MSDPFENSRRKLARAEEHFDDLQREIEDFTELDPYTRVTEPHPDKAGYVIDKLKMTHSLPTSITDITGDLVNNLRSSLDAAAYAIAIASGVVNPKNTAFPFAGSVGQMAQALGRSKDVPQQIQSLFCGFQPYMGGNDLLWALNEMCNADKHKMLIPIGMASVRPSVSVRGTGFFEMPDPHVWDRARNEMVLITLGPGAEFKYDLHFQFFVAFNEIKIVDGQPVLRVLHRLGGIVQSILIAIEAEARRIKIIT